MSELRSGATWMRMGWRMTCPSNTKRERERETRGVDQTSRTGGGGYGGGPGSASQTAMRWMGAQAGLSLCGWSIGDA